MQTDKMVNSSLTVLILTFYFLLVVASAGHGGPEACEKRKCNKGMANYYKTLNCTAVHNNGGCCPSSYHCDAASTTRCAFDGKLYDAREELVGTEVGLPCERCTCSVFDNQARWQCAIFDCFHWPPVPKKCRRVYKEGDCCPSGIHCEGSEGTEGVKGTERVHTCLVGNVTYLEGHVFYPPGDTCSTCTCRPGFNGTFAAPWCVRKPCTFELHAQEVGCAPVFLEKRGCCPFDWRCPTDGDAVLLSSVRPTATSEQCVLGGLRFNLTERLDMGSVQCVECTCLVPPHLTCVRKGGCQECNPAYCVTPNAEYYKELSCRAVHDNDSCCPTRFNCTGVLNKKNKCHFDGELYKHKDELIGTDVGLPCEHCTCHVEQGLASWHCAIPECFNWPLVSQNCRHIIVQDSCCPTGVICGNATGSNSESEDEFFCTFEGVTYAEGHVFETHTSPCKKCVCLRGFNGTLSSPWCEDLVCGFQLHHWPKIVNGCAPIYDDKDNCCPVDWHCPELEDTVVDAAWYTGHSSPSLQCVFGHLRLDLHDSLAARNDTCSVACTCYTPPTLSCVRQANC